MPWLLGDHVSECAEGTECPLVAAATIHAHDCAVPSGPWMEQTGHPSNGGRGLRHGGLLDLSRIAEVDPRPELGCEGPSSGPSQVAQNPQGAGQVTESPPHLGPTGESAFGKHTSGLLEASCHHGIRIQSGTLG